MGLFYKNDNGEISRINDGENIQVSTLPVPSASIIGTVYQYIGDTTQDYIHNYFYECMSDGDETPTYFWKRVDVQPVSAEEIEPATAEKLGVVKPDGTSIFIKPDGTLYTNIWVGTTAKYQEQKYKIPYDTIICITDDDGHAQGESFIINGIKIVPWETGTDEEIKAMLIGAEQDKIDLNIYWSLGEERTVHLDAITAGDAFTTAMFAQDVVLVLMDTGAQSGYKDVNNKVVNFVVGQKDSLSQKGRMNTTNTNSGSWDSCAMRTDLNTKYYNALPTTFRSCLKQFKTVTATEYNASTVTTSNDYIALFAEKEIFGSRTYSNTTEANALTQVDYYKTAANRVKQQAGSNYFWWQRSPNLGSSSYFCYVSSAGNATINYANNTRGIAPFMCI